MSAANSADVKRLLVTAAAGAVLLTGTPSAVAAPAAPEPTVMVTTSLDGQRLPVAAMSGTWSVQHPGRAATLKVTGGAAGGTVTTIESTWVSSMRRTRGLKFFCQADYSTLAPGSQNNTVQIDVQFRTPHGQWQQSGGTQFSHTSQPLDSGGQGIGALLEFLKPATLQWRVRVTVTFYDTSKQTFREEVASV